MDRLMSYGGISFELEKSIFSRMDKIKVAISKTHHKYDVII